MSNPFGGSAFGVVNTGLRLSDRMPVSASTESSRRTRAAFRPRMVAFTMRPARIDVGIVDVAGRGQDSPAVLRRDPRQQPSIRDDRFEQRGRVAEAAAELGVRIQPRFRSLVHAHEDSSVPENGTLILTRRA